MNLSHRKQGCIPLLVIATVAAIILVTPASAKVSTFSFTSDMRKLWEDHITWTRLYIVSLAANLPDKEATAQRLLQNQLDIGNAIKPFYGDDAGNKLTDLLKVHILDAIDVLEAAKASDQTGVSTASAKWYANADEIATFLNTTNPKAWPLADMKTEMKRHLDLTLAEATARFRGDFAADIKGYDEVHAHILSLADLLSTGIISQFPGKFESRGVS